MITLLIKIEKELAKTSLFCNKIKMEYYYLFYMIIISYFLFEEKIIILFFSKKKIMSENRLFQTFFLYTENKFMNFRYKIYRKK